MQHQERLVAKSSRTIRGTLSKYWAFYLLMLPALIYFLIFHYLPMFGVVIAFKKTNAFSGIAEMIKAEWVGFYWFRRFFSSYYFKNLMQNTITISLKRLFFGFPMPILLAILLNELNYRKYKRVVQTISYLPHFISAVVLAGLVSTVLSTNGGIVNRALVALGGESVFFLGRPEYFHGIIVVSSIWQTVGWGSIIYLAAMSGVDPELYEAAKIDGASRFKRIWHITIPGISSIIVIQLILAVGNILNAGFEQILLLYSPAVYSVADIIDTFVYREGLGNLQYSYTTAIGLFKSGIALVLITIANYVARKFEQTGIW